MDDNICYELRIISIAKQPNACNFNLWDLDSRIRGRRYADERCLPECVIECHSWPDYSPDMSPIEHVWDLGSRRLALDPRPAALIDELLLRIQAIGILFHKQTFKIFFTPYHVV
ncbi:hypothetical protein TNCV_975451 [Trichonephila clavipes]|nr:hypothetical protein TNCV_975451 [Trichonephila clavipes]